jgi:hypothetical protein
MKIGLCLHGCFDSSTDATSKGEEGFKYIKKHIIDSRDVDVYIHSWEPHLSSRLEELYSPVLIKTESQIDFSPKCKELGVDNLINPPRRPDTVLSHFYSIEESFKLLYSTDNKYDVVIKSRFDLGQINRAVSTTHVGCINFNTGNDLTRINMAYWDDHWMIPEGPPDAWFYGDHKTMNPFSSVYQNIIANLSNDIYIEDVSRRLGRDNLTNASVLYKQFFIDYNLWENRLALPCQLN